MRKAIGAELARENAVEADLVIPVPESGTPAALGYAQESGIPFELGIIRSHYVGRTFIQPGDKVRHLGVKLKHNANKALIAGKRVVLIDDVATSGGSILKAADQIAAAGGVMTDAIVILDREQGATAMLGERGITLHTLFTATDLGVTEEDRRPID